MTVEITVSISLNRINGFVSVMDAGRFFYEEDVKDIGYKRIRKWSERIIS
jgi:hypothetical protein